MGDKLNVVDRDRMYRPEKVDDSSIVSGYRRMKVQSEYTFCNLIVE
jgi:hypothetical protein